MALDNKDGRWGTGTVSTYAQRFIEELQKVTTVQVSENQLRLVTPDVALTFTRD